MKLDSEHNHSAQTSSYVSFMFSVAVTKETHMYKVVQESRFGKVSLKEVYEGEYGPDAKTTIYKKAHRER